MEFNLSMEFSLQQQKEDSSSVEGDNKFQNSNLMQYNFSSIFLKDKPTTISLFTNKQTAIYNRDFFERSTIENNGYGGRIDIQKEWFPMYLSFQSSKRKIDRTFRSNQNFDDQKIKFNAKPEIAKIGRVLFDYNRDKFSRKESEFFKNTGVNDYLTISNLFSFGEDNKKTLRSYARYSSLAGIRDSRELSLNENLTIKHHDRFTTSYQYGIYRRSNNNIDTNEQLFDFVLTHQLYESLTTIFNFNGDKLKSTSFDNDRTGISVNNNYQKKIKKALLRVGMGHSYDTQKRKAHDNIIYITGEMHVLSDTSIVFFNNQKIDISTILVSNKNGTIVYSEGIDYTIIESVSNGTVEIRRIATGDISDGDAIIVDYISTQNSSFDFVRVKSDINLSIGFFNEKLKIYYRRSKQRYPDIKGDQNLILEALDDRVTGAELRLDYISLLAEHEKYDTNLSPYDSLRFAQTITLTDFIPGNLVLNADQYYVTLPDGERTNYNIRGVYSIRPSRSSILNFEAGYRWQDGPFLDLENTTSRIKYRNRLGRLLLEVGYEYEDEKSLGDSLESHYLYTKLERRF